MSNLKKILAFALTALMIVGLLPTAVFALESETSASTGEA